MPEKTGKVAYLRGGVWLASLLLIGLSATPLRAWGCKGHQTVALIAEKHLTPDARAMVDKILSENPIDPALKRYCGVYAGDLLADGSTWPDDVRNQLKNGAWHYIDIPRGAARGPLESYCGADGCITKAIAEQWAILRDKAAKPGKRAEALRYLVHLVADLHMPLHATTNNDMGGNCVPLQYFRELPREHNGSYSPNLHFIWDVAILENNSKGAEPAALAARVEETFQRYIELWMHAGIQIDDWAWKSHDLAESVAYGELTPKIPIATPAVVHSCADAQNVGQRMLELHVSAAEAYQAAAARVVEERLEQAGVRLALMLNDAAKPAPTKD
jgi:hypothetical protein